MYSVLADLILIFHAGIVAFNLFSLPVIIIGRQFRREFVHNPWFRYSHLASMGVGGSYAMMYPGARSSQPISSGS